MIRICVIKYYNVILITGQNIAQATTVGPQEVDEAVMYVLLIFFNTCQLHTIIAHNFTLP